MKLFLDSEEIDQNKEHLSNSNVQTKKLRSKEILLQTDGTNLLHVIEVLEHAIDQSKTHRTKNFVKAIQQ